jgi:peptidoglycan-associated lipoprotein
MPRRLILTVLALALTATAASAQLPGLRKRTATGQQQQPVLSGMDALRSDFTTRAGADAVYFGVGSAVLSAPAKVTLGAQAQWIRQHPEVVVRIEGYGDGGDTRDHALAVGGRRAEEVRAYLVLLGVPAAQLTATTYGKERSGAPRVVTALVR